MIEGLRKNIEIELRILREISYYNRLRISEGGGQKILVQKTIDALKNNIKNLNNSIPGILNKINIARELPKVSESKENHGLERVIFNTERDNYKVTLSSKEKERFLIDLRISEELIKKIKRRKPDKELEKEIVFKESRGYLKLSNRFFRNTARTLIRKGMFENLSRNIRRANIDILFQTYVSMIFFTTFLSLLISLGLMGFLFFFNVGTTFPFVSYYSGSYLSRAIGIFWIPIAVPLLTFVALYFYPGTERGSLGKKIDQELPFAVIHMSAISGSGIEPTKIFKIIGLSKDYRYLGKEIRKVLNQINLYGYDLVTALNNTSRTTSSTKLAELFAGLSTTINSGGNLKEFFDKRSETLLISYRLEREKFTKIAETFMDVYISVVIATPMILLLLLVMISVSGIQVGLGPNQITLLIIIGLALINVIFIGVLHMKQPSY